MTATEHHQELALDQMGLFPVPVWTVDLSPYFADDLATMVSDVDWIIDEDRAPAPLEQSRAAISALTTEPWPRYHQVLAQICEGLLARAWPEAGYEVGRLATWGLRMAGPSGGGLLRHLHAHPRAMLSSVLYLQIPDELVDHRHGGTLFRDPNASNTSYMAERPLARIAARPLRLVVFPAWLEHAPAEPPTGGRYSKPRIVVATDVICF